MPYTERRRHDPLYSTAYMTPRTFAGVLVSKGELLPVYNIKLFIKATEQSLSLRLIP